MSLVSIHHPLAAPEQQRGLLESRPPLTPFAAAVAENGSAPLSAAGISVLQINVGKLCNQTCKHCHVDAGPDRREIMGRDVAELCMDALRRSDIATVDITGGAPELNPNFRWIVQQSRALGRHVMDRCNLTVLLLPSQADLADFLADHDVEVIASLPYFVADRTDAQRGDGVFDKSIEAIRKLNQLGYARPGSNRKLNLVYNPVGAFLPPAQHAIEADYRRELDKRYGIAFNSLYTITNMPISRFLEFLVRTGNYERYIEKLVNSFNPAAIDGLMCRYTISVGWDGSLYDCDFNQMLEMKINGGAPSHIREFDAVSLGSRVISVGQHCYGCTAGAGSSCGGATSGSVNPGNVM